MSRIFHQGSLHRLGGCIPQLKHPFWVLLNTSESCHARVYPLFPPRAMGNETHANEDFNSESPGPASYGVFSGSHHFTVAGGTFTNTTMTNNYHTTPTVPSSNCLQHGLFTTCSVKYTWTSTLTLWVIVMNDVVFEGYIPPKSPAESHVPNTSQEWRRDVVQYMAVRHPNIVQLCATASYGNIYATIFHDGAIPNFSEGDTDELNLDLIPLRQFLELHRQSHLAAAYVYVCTNVEFQVVWDYFASTFQYDVDDDECTFFQKKCHLPFLQFAGHYSGYPSRLKCEGCEQVKTDIPAHLMRSNLDDPPSNQPKLAIANFSAMEIIFSRKF
ncbi:hypothetical protein DFH08DRAFT_828503 [Mycena albidolilacea]|uniref:Uncharacterized protein n=1 Tax=Mycena albidolilacea TaxID=1033008 RepID=A0AAD7E730_9AGAR|nr:hypothetical protein DFH08DRAFT_828503 [Mycena albidolilacea]